jgi:uncharacterized glyoxalase superfamily protein PhnB
MLKTNRSMPAAAVVPVLHYPDVRQAVGWLCTVLGFVERLRIAEHRCQLLFGDSALVVAGAASVQRGGGGPTLQSVMLRVAHIDEVFQRARDAGAAVLTSPVDQPYGERQCAFNDPWGHAWTLSETIADADPASWGGELVR